MRRPVAVLALLASAGVAGAAPVLPTPVTAGERLLAGPLPAPLDSSLAFAYRLARTTPLRDANDTHPILGRSVNRIGLRVGLRFARAVSEDDAAGVQRRGCDVARLPGGALAAAGPVVTAFCPWEALWRLTAYPGLVRVAATFGQPIVRPALPPTSPSLRDVEAPQLGEALFPRSATGKGVVVADVDSMVDPYHPFFFRADG